MILKHLPALNALKIVLASGSPRRKEILNNVGFVSFDVVKSSFAENLDKESFRGAASYAQATAWMKAKEVCENWDTEECGPVPDIVIGADTVVESDAGVVMEKPITREEACGMLSSLSNSKSKVHTGVAIFAPKFSPMPSSHGEEGSDKLPPVAFFGKSFSETTIVEFAQLSQEEIEAYVDSGEPFDKAGGYGIQGAASLLIKGIVGDYFNVMGFPIHAFARELEKMLPDIFASRASTQDETAPVPGDCPK
eukprot:INCI16528.1.p1 GENE.INCI16528.1~~INCI16528.1.p1  ORF type:complete len:251 (+),score=52.12 INCI16528.1:151-903(+)